MGIHRRFYAPGNLTYRMVGLSSGGMGHLSLAAERKVIEWGHWYDRIVETAILIVLLMEYFYGRSDTDIKREAVRKKAARDKYKFDTLTSGEGK